VSTSSTTAVEALRVEGEVISEQGAPSHIQKAHPTQQIIYNMNERITRSLRQAYLSCFTNTLFITLFEPLDVEHALSDSSWVNVMHE
jgi:UDP-N-acetylglucosamine 2-epimerase